MLQHAACRVRWSGVQSELCTPRNTLYCGAALDRLCGRHTVACGAAGCRQSASAVRIGRHAAGRATRSGPMTPGRPSQRHNRSANVSQEHFRPAGAVGVFAVRRGWAQNARATAAPPLTYGMKLNYSDQMRCAGVCASNGDLAPYNHKGSAMQAHKSATEPIICKSGWPLWHFRPFFTLDPGQSRQGGGWRNPHRSSRPTVSQYRITTFVVMQTLGRCQSTRGAASQRPSAVSRASKAPSSRCTRRSGTYAAAANALCINGGARAPFSGMPAGSSRARSMPIAAAAVSAEKGATDQTSAAQLDETCMQPLSIARARPPTGAHGSQQSTG